VTVLEFDGRLRADDVLQRKLGSLPHAEIGLLPNTEWLDGTIELTGRKEIVTDERGATSIPGVCLPRGDNPFGAGPQCFPGDAPGPPDPRCTAWETGRSAR
jgi:alkyl hydroperoxide reductase subunit AhpF